MAEHVHSHAGGCCDHDHGHDHGHSHEVPDTRIKNKDNLDVAAEADIDLDAMHPEIEIPAQKWPLTEQELADDFVMVTDDGGIKKKILVESKESDADSSSSGPPPNSKVICHYTGTLPDSNNEQFDSSRDRGEPFEFKIGAGRVIQGWDIGIASMKKGERCILRCAYPYAYGEAGSPPKIPSKATLDFDVELIDWDDWEAVAGAEGQLKKRVMAASDAGDDAEVAEDAAVILTYRYFYRAGDDHREHVLCERLNYAMTVDDDDRFTNAFHLCVKSMKCGEQAMFEVLDDALLNTQDVYVDEQELATFPDNNNQQRAPCAVARYFYEITVQSQTKAPEKWNADNPQRIAKGGEYKEAGNALFKAGRVLGAVQKYEKALDWIDVDFSDEALAQQKRELLVSANNNLALIAIKRKDWSEATARATKVLEQDADNLKALMRRGQSRLYSGFLEESKADLKRAHALDKENAYVKKMLKVCSQKHKEYVQKQQQLYAGMFGGGGKNKKKKKTAEKIEKETEKEKEKETDDKDVSEKVAI